MTFSLSSVLLTLSAAMREQELDPDDVFVGLINRYATLLRSRLGTDSARYFRALDVAYRLSRSEGTQRGISRLASTERRLLR